MPTKEKLLQQSKEYELAVTDLFKREETGYFLGKASELKEKLEIAAANFQHLPQTDRNDQSVIDAEKLIRVLLLRVESLATANQVCRDSAKVLFAEAGQWARHFSVVRMTVMTFTITTCIAILAWQWGKGGANSGAVTNAAAFLWTLGASVFWIFTYATYREVAKQREILPIFLPKPPKRKELRYDWTSLVILALCIGSVLGVAYYKPEMEAFFVALLVLNVVVALIFCMHYREAIRRK